MSSKSPHQLCADDRKFTMLLGELMDKVEEHHTRAKLKKIVS